MFNQRKFEKLGFGESRILRFESSGYDHAESVARMRELLFSPPPSVGVNFDLVAARMSADPVGFGRLLHDNDRIIADIDLKEHKRYQPFCARVDKNFTNLVGKYPELREARLPPDLRVVAKQFYYYLRIHHQDVAPERDSEIAKAFSLALARHYMQTVNAAKRSGQPFVVRLDKEQEGQDAIERIANGHIANGQLLQEDGPKVDNERLLGRWVDEDQKPIPWNESVIADDVPGVDNEETRIADAGSGA